MKHRGGVQRSAQGTGSTLRHHWPSGGIDQGQQAPGVGGSNRDGDVTSYGGDQFYLQFWRAQGEYQGQGIIDARIGINGNRAWGDDGHGH
jgi:hypothetical protein